MMNKVHAVPSSASPEESKPIALLHNRRKNAIRKTPADVSNALMTLGTYTQSKDLGLKFGASFSATLRCTLVSMMGALVVAALCSGAGAGTVYLFLLLVAALHEQHDGEDGRAARREEEEKVLLVEAEIRWTALVLSVMWSLFCCITCGALAVWATRDLWYLNLKSFDRCRRTRILMGSLVSGCIVFVVSFISLYHLLMQSSSAPNKYIVAVVCILFGFLYVFFAGFYPQWAWKESGGPVEDLVNEAQMNARSQTLPSDEPLQGTEKKERSLMKKTLLICLPAIFVNITQTAYVLVIFPLSRALPHAYWKMFVFLLALSIKVIGNKKLIALFLSLDVDITHYSSEFVIYWYELTTSLLCRVLLLSTPTTEIAIFLSLFNSVLETQIRNWFYMLYMTRGVGIESKPADEKARYYKFGMSRVCDSSNDMSVQHVTTIVGAFLTYRCSQHPSFDISTALQSDEILRIVAWQLFPSIFVDFYCVALECKGGLMSQHEQYWRIHTEGEGLFALSIKVVFTPVVVCWVVLMVLK